MSNAELFVLVQTIAESLRIWVKRGEVALTEDQIFERARNIADGLRGNYMIVPLPDGVPERIPQWDTPLISDGEHMYGCRCGRCPVEVDVRRERPAGVIPYHGWSCMCSTCADAKQKERQ